MSKVPCQSQPTATPPWGAGLAYVGALVGGVILIWARRTIPAEASLYVAPFLAAYRWRPSR